MYHVPYFSACYIYACRHGQCGIALVICNSGVPYICCTGAAAIFTQFDIDQFRSIAWYNVAAGVLFVALLVLLFHGEAGCSEIRKRRHNCCKKFNASWKLIKLPSGLNTRCLEFLISFSIYYNTPALRSALFSGQTDIFECFLNQTCYTFCFS